MSTDNLAGILDTVTRHQERADSRTSDATIGAHESIDDLIATVAHGARVTALNEAITKIREIIDLWNEEIRVAETNKVDKLVIFLQRQHISALQDLAFRLLSSVDEK